MNTLTKKIGQGFAAVAAVWVGYMVVALTLGGSFEQALVDEADKLGVPENRLPAEVLARIYDDHMFTSLVGLPLLLVAPAVLLLTAVGVRRCWPSPAAEWCVRSAAVSAGIWWVYLLIDLGAYGDPDHLPPLTRDLEVLAVPLVASSSAFGVVSVIAAAVAMRPAGSVRKAATAAAVVATVVLVAGTAGMVLSGFGDPLPPVAVVPPSLILGVALLRAARKERRPSVALSIPVGQRED
jgi:hypothetical protein